MPCRPLDMFQHLVVSLAVSTRFPADVIKTLLQPSAPQKIYGILSAAPLPVATAPVRIRM